MSKDNRDMSIEEKFIYWDDNYEYDGNDGLRVYEAFKAGYLLAQKEMQEKLDAAIKVIEWYMNNSPEKGGCVDDNFTHVIRHIVPSNKRARDFLKARGEK